MKTLVAKTFQFVTNLWEGYLAQSVTDLMYVYDLCVLVYVTVPGKRDHFRNFFKIELLLQQERVGFELQNALHI